MRKLTEEELQLYEQNLELNQKRLEELEYYLEYEELIIKKGLKINYEKQLQEHERNFNKLKEEYEGTKFAIRDCTLRISTGLTEDKGEDDGN